MMGIFIRESKLINFYGEGECLSLAVEKGYGEAKKVEQGTVQDSFVLPSYCM
jgi:hypothetical protein